MKYEIIATGSKGNCVIINDVMIDAGVPFGKIKEHLYDIRYLLLTHIHGDHIKPSTVKNIKSLFPKITIIGNWEVHQSTGVDIICNHGYEVITDDYTFRPFECKHDVVTTGYTWEFEGLSILYATDLNNTDTCPEGKYDFIFLESNFDQKKLDKVDDNKYGYNVTAGAKRHLSTQESKAFYYMNRKDKESKWIELHQSHRFY